MPDADSPLENHSLADASFAFQSLLITAASPVEPVISSPSYDRRLLRETFGAVASTQQVDDMPAALKAVEQIRSESEAPPGHRAVYILSDFPASVWQHDAAGHASSASVMLQRLLEGVGESNLFLARVGGTGWENLAVTDLKPQQPLIHLAAPATLTARIQNFGGKPVRNAVVQLYQGTQLLGRQTIPLLEERIEWQKQISQSVKNKTP